MYVCTVSYYAVLIGKKNNPFTARGIVRASGQKKKIFSKVILFFLQGTNMKQRGRASRRGRSQATLLILVCILVILGAAASLVLCAGPIPAQRLGASLSTWIGSGSEKSNLVLFGGFSDHSTVVNVNQTFFNDVWIFDPSKKKLFSKTRRFQFFFFFDFFFFFEYFAEAKNSGTGQWSQLMPASGSLLPRKRAFHSASVSGDSLFVFGGCLDSPKKSYGFGGCTGVNDVWELDLSMPFIIIIIVIRSFIYNVG